MSCCLSYMKFRSIDISHSAGAIYLTDFKKCAPPKQNNFTSHRSVSSFLCGMKAFQFGVSLQLCHSHVMKTYLIFILLDYIINVAFGKCYCTVAFLLCYSANIVIFILPVLCLDFPFGLSCTCTVSKCLLCHLIFIHFNPTCLFMLYGTINMHITAMTLQFLVCFCEL